MMSQNEIKILIYQDNSYPENELDDIAYSNYI